MSSLRESIHKNDFLMDKSTKKLHFVVKIDMHNVILRVEDDGDDVELKKVAKHFINKFMIKVNADVMKILYGDKSNENKINTDNIPTNSNTTTSEG